MSETDLPPRRSARRRSRQVWLQAELVLAAVVVFCPLAIATVSPWALAVAAALGLIACGLAAWASVRSGEPFAVPLPAWAFVAATAWIALQLVPLPPAVISLLAPRTAELFEFVLGPLGHYPAWRPLSLDPPATARELAKAITYLAVFLATVQVARSRRARSRLLIVLGGAGLVVALIGFGHALWGASALFGVFSYTWAQPPFLSTFGNPNHLASFLSLGATALLARVLVERDRKIATLWAFGYFAAGVGVLLTLSRGGIVAFVGAQAMLAVAVYLTRRSEREGRRFEPRRLVVPAAVLVVLGVSCYLAWDALAKEFASTDSMDKLRGSKLAFWPTFVPMVAAHWLTGVGRGGFEAAYQAFQPTDLGATFTHPENLAFQWVTELGVPMGLVLMVACGWALGRAFWRGGSDVERLAAVFGVAAIALHEIVDFGLELPGLAVPVSVAFAIAVSNGDDGARVKRRAAFALVPPGALLAVLALFAAHRSLEAEGTSLAAGLGVLPAEELAARASDMARRHPADYFPHLLAAQAWAAEVPMRADRVLASAGRAMFLNDAHPRPHRLAALALRAMGRDSQARVEYRLASERGDGTVLVEVAGLYEDPGELLEAVPRTEVALLALADELLRRGRLDAAAAVLEAAVEQSGEQPPILQRQARVAMARQEPAEALRLGQRLTELAPEQPLGLFTRVAALQLQGDRKAAIGLLEEEGLAHFRLDAEVVLQLASLRLSDRDYAGCRKALKLLPPGINHGVRLRALRMEASAAEREGQLVKAVNLIRTAVTLAPKDAGLKWQHALMLERAGRLELAIREAEAAAVINRQLEPEVAKLKARAEKKLQQLRELERWREVEGVNGAER